MQAAKFLTVPPNKSYLILILILASQLSASFAGGPRKVMDKSTMKSGDATKESPKSFSYGEEAFVAHPRILTVKTNDYGSYDPSPTFAKPPFKLIPN